MVRALESLQRGEILIPHEEEYQPVMAVRNTLLQASLSELRDAGYYERYARNIDPAILRELSSNLAPSWVSIDLADAHYQACDEMSLSTEELHGLGQAVGVRVRQTSIVVADNRTSNAPVDVWTIIGHLHRVWKRVYQGGSVQITRLGPRDELIELRGHTLYRHAYYRFASLAAITAAHEAVGARIELNRIVRYDVMTHEIVYHLAWA
jgi:hypothetical protein